MLPSPAPPTTLSNLSEPWTFQGNRGTAFRTPHYRLLTTVRRSIVADRLPSFAESSLARFRALFPSLPEPRAGLEIFVLDSRPEWERFVIEVFGPEGVDRYGGIDRGGFTERGRSVLWDIGVQDTFAILAHEGWHQYVQTTLKDPLPAWLDEGLAAWSEGFRWNPRAPSDPVFLPWANVERFDQLRTAAGREGLVPLEQLLTERPQQLIKVSPESTLNYYAQCWALAAYLDQTPQRRRALNQLLADAAAGRLVARVRDRAGDRAAQSLLLRRTGIEVWQAYFGEDLAAETDRFSDFLQQIVRPGSKQAIVEGRSPLQ
ncbi:MAG: hypothetical protein IPJ41_13825 [Phycisphaerales bacterium]|nr:hypothetical protein [Phycisphaerales bacterium]